MRKLIASISNEVLLLLRDKYGILILFIMPAVLVLVITLVQENVLKTTIQVLILDKDKGLFGHTVKQLLSANPSIELIQITNKDEETVKTLVSDGEYQFCIIIPQGISKELETWAEHMATAPFSEEKQDTISKIIVYFDPTVQGGFRSALQNALQRVFFAVETRMRQSSCSAYLKQLMLNTAGIDISAEIDAVIEVWMSEKQIIGIDERFAIQGNFNIAPTSVQQNVPAWSLFGIFFIVIPLAGSLIKERNEGTLKRLLIMPVSYFILLSGKLFAYVLVCIAQFCFILLIGRYALPLLGAPMLDMGHDPAAICVIAFCAILAATGCGVLLGTITKTFHQASAIGAVFVVISSAFGGIIVPVFAMPPAIRSISEFSPLGWGHQAFLDIFVRGGSIKTVFPYLIALIALFVVTLLISWVIFLRNAHHGG